MYYYKKKIQNTYTGLNCQNLYCLTHNYILICIFGGKYKNDKSPRMIPTHDLQIHT